MGDTSGNDCGVGGQMSDPGQGCRVGGGMVGRGDKCGMGEGMVGVGDGCGMGEGMVGVGDGCGVDGEGWGGRDNPRGRNRQTRGTSGRSCAHAWARRSSYLLIRGLRDGRLYTVKEVHCR